MIPYTVTSGEHGMLATNWIADPQRYPFVLVTLARMESRQTSKYQRYKPRRYEFAHEDG
jgi:hypothetical protein